MLRMHFLIMEIDAANPIEEEYEQNNLAIARFDITSGPDMDLVAESLTVPGEAIIGEEFDINLLISNPGTETAHDVRVMFFVSDSSEYDWFLGAFVGSMTLDTVPGGGAEPIEYTFTSVLPGNFIESGQEYYLRALIDSEHQYDEWDEVNNIVTSAPLTATAGEIDLSAQINNSSAQATWGEMVPLELTVTNTGQLDAAPFFVDVLLSSDSAWDESDFYLPAR